ncbi:hypothetical protein AGJ34_21880 [Cronobacter dublinensis subsp. dublinensis]|nr:hypothetical protein [Cronobacter dublinensis subsp. dublinensis]EGT5729928.1 hypothetical protein [Cronobacter dublinensis subsp. dublinensis]
MSGGFYILTNAGNIKFFIQNQQTDLLNKRRIYPFDVLRISLTIDTYKPVRMDGSKTTLDRIKIRHMPDIEAEIDSFLWRIFFEVKYHIDFEDNTVIVIRTVQPESDPVALP